MKKLSLILAIVMLAGIFTVIVPTSVAAEEPEYEVLINGVPWESLADAMVFGVIDEATEDTTITLLKDMALPSAIAFTSKNTKADGSPVVFTFDLNGHTVESSASNAFQVGRNKDNAANAKENVLIMKNGTINHNGPGSVVQIYSYGRCDLENLIINCTEKVKYCVINTMTGSDKTGLKMVLTVKNVESTLPTKCSTSQTAFFRTGNPADPRSDDPSVEAYFENCNFNTVGAVPAENPVRACFFRSTKATVVLKNVTLSSPMTPLYCDDEIKTNNTVDGVVTPKITVEDCLFTNHSGEAVMNNPECITVKDDPNVTDGFLGFEMPGVVVTLPEAPETSAVPETTPVPETSAVPETTPAPETTEAPTTNAPETTEAPTTNAPTTDAPTTDAPTSENKGGGCGGFTVAASFLAVICAAGAAIVIKKK